MKNLMIRPITEGDILPHDLLLSADPSEEAIEQYLPYSTLYLAHLNDLPVAEYVLYPHNTEDIEIKNIAVDDAFQGRGIGKALLEDAVQRAIDDGYKCLLIGTSNASVGQLYLYQRQGFEISSIKMNFFTDNYPTPLYENGIQCRHMLMLTKVLKP
ncbi:GNAT family N-acetyltransferase [Emticicia agri]|uniref:N-acetyltransferase n=1 Tax=Emticicia agri TaxID=2492393 RepID=A0A4Q5M1L3_9BACT|nr:GNAT family N-acetyltransferase [Emticicia agri]RYU95727.1 N-acetyltransferase [Emticicia agri]